MRSIQAWFLCRLGHWPWTLCTSPALPWRPVLCECLPNALTPVASIHKHSERSVTMFQCSPIMLQWYNIHQFGMAPRERSVTMFQCSPIMLQWYNIHQFAMAPRERSVSQPRCPTSPSDKNFARLVSFVGNCCLVLHKVSVWLPELRKPLQIHTYWSTCKETVANSEAHPDLGETLT